MLSLASMKFVKSPAQILKIVKTAVIGTLITVALLVASHYSYNLFHCIVELVGILIAFTIFIIVYSTYSISDNHALTYYGISYGFVCVFSSLHLITFIAIGAFPGNSANLGIYYSLSSKYIESLSFLLIYLLYAKQHVKVLKPKTVAYFFSVLSTIVITASLINQKYSIKFLNGIDDTAVKRVNEFIITVILFVTLVAFLLYKKENHQDIFFNIIMFLAIKIVSQIFFISYSNIYDIYNVIGHIVRLASLYYIYKAIIETSLKKPMNLLFTNMNYSKIELENKTIQLQKMNEQLLKENLERQQAEEMLHKSREHYKQLIDLLPDGLLLHSSGIITFVNKAGLKMLRVSDESEIIGKPVIDIVAQNSKSIVIERMGHIYSDSLIVPLMEEKLLRLDGTTVDVEVVGAPIVNGSTVSAMVIARDITDRKKSEEYQRNMYEQELLLKKALEMDRTKTEFFANISHELRTPLNIILSTLQLLSKYLEDNTIIENCKMIHHFSIMNRNGHRLLRLINNLIDITKIDGGYMKPQFQNCNIIQVIEDIAQSIFPFMESKGIRFVFDTEVEERYMACDPEQIERILVNLLSNATKFTESEGSIFVNIMNKEDSVLICVRDTGIGIPRDKQRTIFERFSQVDPLLTRNYEGSGIGLSLVKAFVEMHGGTILLESEPGYGSTFTIELPVQLLEHSTNGIRKEIGDIIQPNAGKIDIEFSGIY